MPRKDNLLEGENHSEGEGEDKQPQSKLFKTIKSTFMYVNSLRFNARQIVGPSSILSSKPEEFRGSKG